MTTELPWYLPPKAQEKVDRHKPFTLSGYLGLRRVNGDFTADTTDLGVIAQAAPQFSVGLVISTIDAKVTPSTEATLPDLVFGGKIFGARADIFRYFGREIYAKDGVRAFVLFPAVSFELATNAWNEESMTTFSSHLRLIGGRVQICPGIHIDISAVYSLYAGGSTRKVDPFMDFSETYSWFGTGDGFGVELEGGFTWWQEPK